MDMRKMIFVGVFLLGSGAAAAHAQECTSSQDDAVKCFVTHAVKTNLTSPRYGMTLAQFRAYGVAVSHILQSQSTSMVLAGTASGIADAMPPTNANGSANPAAQTTALNAIVNDLVTSGIVTIPAEVNTQDLEWFSLDLVSSMGQNSGVMLSAGTPLRLMDSYIVASTVNGVVNWTQANAALATMVSNLTSAGLLKLPSTVTVAQVTALVQSIAQAIYNYKTATNRAQL
jgi:hypothetical protein